jgi:hypothetical protein
MGIQLWVVWGVVSPKKGGISMYQNGYQGNQGGNFWQQAPFQPPLENREIIEL